MSPSDPPLAGSGPGRADPSGARAGGRIVGLEVEYALGFRPEQPGGPQPPQEVLFHAVLAGLKTRLRSCEALYYKGGEFLENGSLIHFEVARLEDPRMGLLEWATPECLGPREAAAFTKAQEQALRAALGPARQQLERDGFAGAPYLLKNNEDRAGNPYGCHESYDVGERPPGVVGRICAWVVHPALLVGLGLLGLCLALPFLALLICAGALLHALDQPPPLGGWLRGLAGSVGHGGRMLLLLLRAPAAGPLVRLIRLPFLLAGGGIGLGFAALAVCGALLVGPLWLALHLAGRVLGSRRWSRRLRERLYRVLEFLVEVGPTPGSGMVAHTVLWGLRAGAWLFSFSARSVLFRGHLPALFPFLATRPVLAGAGTLRPDGRYELSPRARAIRRPVAAFIFGPGRPLVDVKEFFYRNPLGYLNPRKRLHLLAGDSNRSEYSEWLKLATTAAVLDAIEAGALDPVARGLTLLGGPLGAFRRTCRDPGLRDPVARDRRTGAPLTALDVQRRYLEAVWEFQRAREPVPPEVKDCLVRWNFVLDALADQADTLDRELDWVIKRKLLSVTLEASLPDRPVERAWADLAAWGPVNALVERRAPGVDFPGDGPPEVELTLAAALGGRAFRQAARHVARAGLAWDDFAPVRRAWLRLKVVDLRYHEISAEGGFHDWLAEAGRVARLLDPADVTAAESHPPRATRASIRGRWVGRSTTRTPVRVGWDRIVVEERGDPRTIRLDDPYQHEE